MSHFCNIKNNVQTIKIKKLIVQISSLNMFYKQSNQPVSLRKSALQKSVTLLYLDYAFQVNFIFDLFFYNGIAGHRHSTNTSQHPAIDCCSRIHRNGLHGHNSSFHYGSCPKSC